MGERDDPLASRARAGWRSSCPPRSPTWRTGRTAATGCWAPVASPYRGDQVAAQAPCSGPVRYDITQDPARGRWYMDASWKTAPGPRAVPG